VPSESAARRSHRPKHLIFIGSGPGQGRRPRTATGSWGRPAALPHLAPGGSVGVHGVPIFWDSVFMVTCWPFIDMIIVVLA
jgi:hypothetical protein